MIGFDDSFPFQMFALFVEGQLSGLHSPGKTHLSTGEFEKYSKSMTRWWVFVGSKVCAKVKIGWFPQGWGVHGVNEHKVFEHEIGYKVLGSSGVFDFFFVGNFRPTKSANWQCIFEKTLRRVSVFRKLSQVLTGWIRGVSLHNSPRKVPWNYAFQAKSPK